MFYDLVEFSDGMQAVREVDSYGRITRYCTLAGVDVGRLHEQVNIVGTASPPWALSDPAPEEPQAPAPSRRISKLQFVGLLGDDFVTILAASKQNVAVEMFVKMLDWATPETDGTSVDLDDPRVTGALAQLEAAGLLAEGRAKEIVGA